MQSNDPALRIVGMRAMAIVGGPDALAAVKSAIADKEEEVQDEAVRTLSTWPNKWTQDSAAGEVLLTLAKSGKKTSHQVLGLRGYLQYLRGDKSLAGADKMAKINDLLGLIQRPEEERLAIAVLGGVEAPGALELLMKFAADPPVAEEAYSAIVSVAGKNVQGVSVEQRRSALQTVVEKSKNAGTRRRAEGLLRNI
jgi:HEAT repeat protein